MKLGVNSVLFAPNDLKTAMQHVAWAGYQGIEISAIKGMCEHLEIDNWKAQAADIKAMSADLGLELLSMEFGGVDVNRLPLAFEAAAGVGIPIVNIGPGGKSGSDEDFERQSDQIAQMAEKAAAAGVTLCCKAHVGCCIDNTPTTLRAMKKITSPAFGVDMDPSHIHRANENSEEALAQVISRVKHVHIRDCRGRQAGPGDACNQACGRGEINLYGYFKVLVDANYQGPVSLEIIGAKDYPLSRQAIIASESYGYMNACLKTLAAAKAAGCPSASGAKK